MSIAAEFSTQELRTALIEIAEACEKAAHPGAPIVLSYGHVEHLKQIASRARAALSHQGRTAA